MNRLVWVCLLGLGCSSKHASVLPPIDSGAGSPGGPEAGADVVAVGASPGCDARAGIVDADPAVVTLDCSCNFGSPPPVLATIYDSTSGTVPTCTYALPSYDPSAIEFALYFNRSLVGVSRAPSTDLMVSADGTEVTLTGSYCTDIQSGAPSLVQVLFACIILPVGPVP